MVCRERKLAKDKILLIENRVKYRFMLTNKTRHSHESHLAANTAMAVTALTNKDTAARAMLVICFTWTPTTTLV